MIRFLKKNNKGFTISETLVTVLILLIVFAIIGEGLPLALRAYKSVGDISEREVLLSTALSEMRDELSCAKNVEVDGNTIKYVDPYTKTRQVLSNAPTGGIVVTSVTSNTQHYLVKSEENMDDVYLGFVVNPDYNTNKNEIIFDEIYVYDKNVDDKVTSVTNHAIWIVMD